MKKLLLALPFLLFAATPANATGGYQCNPVGGRGPVLNLVVGHTVSARPVAVSIREGKKTVATTDRGEPLVIGQSWIDERYLWIDLLDRDANRFEAKLRATFNRKVKGRPAIGTLVRGGRTYQVRCVEA